MVRTQTTDFKENLEPYVRAMMGASGLTLEQAKTCVYFAIYTHHMGELAKAPTLNFQGPTATGKTSAMEQLTTLVCKPKVIKGRTFPTVRDELDKTTTALIDEADKIEGLEELLTYRYSRGNGTLTVNKIQPRGGYQPVNLDLFGATVVVRRTPFADTAFRGRVIVINTKSRRGDYEVTNVSGFEEVAMMIQVNGDRTSHRIKDTWEPVVAVARTIQDQEWLNYAEGEMRRETNLLKNNQGLEPHEAMIYVLQIHKRNVSSKVKVSALKDTLNTNYDLKLTASQIMDLCTGWGLNTSRPQGYPTVEIVPERIDDLVWELEENATD